MTLQKILKDNRYTWQNTTQENILKELLLKKKKQSQLGRKKEEKLVVVFGKPQTGKTTLILSLMGVDEEKLSEISEILRADMDKGNSSTATAIIYQRSDNDKFGISEHKETNDSEFTIKECNEKEFKCELKEIRKRVEEQKQESVVRIYIPSFFFSDSSKEYANINILDVPGVGSRNKREKAHVQIILNKYLTAATLNIIIWELNRINDLRDFKLPNGDRLDRMFHKYIVVTTYSYTQESIARYFQEGNQEEEFGEYLKKECDKKFKEIFGEKIPQYFPVDVGESFKRLLTDKIRKEEDKKNITAYRDEVFDSIRNLIQERKGNALATWFKEIREYVSYNQKERKEEIEQKIREKEEAKEKKENSQKKEKKNHEKICENIDFLKNKKKDLESQNKFFEPKMEVDIDQEVEKLVNEHFTEEFERKEDSCLEDVSALFIREVFREVLNKWLQEFRKVLDNCLQKNVVQNIEERKKEISKREFEIKAELDKEMYPHRLLKVFNPSNREKIEIGREKIKDELRKWGEQFMVEEKELYTDEAKNIETEICKFEIINSKLQGKIKGLEKDIEKLREAIQNLKDEQNDISKRIRQEEDVLNKFKHIARQNYLSQKKDIRKKIENCDAADKLKYILLLELIRNDFRKMEVIG